MLKYLSDITPELQNEINRLGGLFFTPKDIAVMLEIDIEFMATQCANENSPIYKKWRGGWLEAEIELRTANKKMAKAGSSQAQSAMLELLEKQQIKLRMNG